MPAGRPSKKSRSAFAARVHALRTQAKLSQIEVAAKLGIVQQSYAMWERRDVALSVSQIEQLAEIFGVPVTAFFAPELTEAVKPRGPTGRARKTFDALSELSRNQQTRVLNLVEPLVRVVQREREEKQAKAARPSAAR
jgi:transcriptional regulator with XRE-family HTH domain